MLYNMWKLTIKCTIPFVLCFTLLLNSNCGLIGRERSDKFSHAFDPFLALDAKTGEYIGVVISECRDWESKKPISYKIRLKDGSEIERTPDSIVIKSP